MSPYDNILCIHASISLNLGFKTVKTADPLSAHRFRVHGARGAVTSTVLTGGRAANYQASLRASLQQTWQRHETLSVCFAMPVVSRAVVVYWHSDF